jgi:DNA-binding NtrC family response regulator
MAQPGSLLVVDDEPEVVDVLRDFFEAEGYLVNCALNGRDALVLATLSRPDAVILDVRMPGRSGTDVLRDLLELDGSIAVVMLSGIDEEAQARELLKAGAFDYVRKPFRFDNLQHVIELAVLMGKRKTLPEDVTPWQCGPRPAVDDAVRAVPDGLCGRCRERVGDGDATAVRERGGLYHAACWLGRMTQGLGDRVAPRAGGPLLDTRAAS